MSQHARFFSKVKITDGCWEWLGTRSGGNDGHSYGTISIAGKNVGTHRIVYEWFVGKIPEGLAIDHLCCNKICVNPAHLEAVTREVNWERKVGWTSPAEYARRTHCNHGHEYVGRNVMWVDHRRKSGKYSHHRICRTCHNEYFRNYRKKHRQNKEILTALNEQQSH